MSLKIDLGKGQRCSYWYPSTALGEIRTAALLVLKTEGRPGWLPDELCQRILRRLPDKSLDPAFLHILGRWIYPFQFKTLRYALGQPTNVRYYPDFVQAAAALVGEYCAEENLRIERRIGAQLAGSSSFAATIAGLQRRIVDYVDTTAKAKNPVVYKACTQRRCEYLPPVSVWVTYRQAFVAEGVLGVWKALLKEPDPSFGELVAAMHDASVLIRAGIAAAVAQAGREKLSRDDFIEATRFTPMPDAALAVTVWQPGQSPAVSVETVASIPDPLDNGRMMRWTLSAGVGIDQRTPNEQHPAILYARKMSYPLQMGPSRTTLQYLNLARNAGLSRAELAQLALALVAYWHRVYSRACSMIHCYHFAMQAAVNNFDVTDEDILAALPSGPEVYGLEDGYPVVLVPAPKL